MRFHKNLNYENKNNYLVFVKGQKKYLVLMWAFTEFFLICEYGSSFLMSNICFHAKSKL